MLFSRLIMNSWFDFSMYSACVLAFCLFVYLITKARVKHYNELEWEILATKDSLWSNLHGLAISAILAFALVDTWQALVTMTTFEHEISFESLMLGSRITRKYHIAYLVFGMLSMICLSWALVNEVKISRRLKKARVDLLLGRMVENNDGSWKDTRGSRAMPTQELPSQPATFETVLQAMEAELEKAIDAAKHLKFELDETKQKVVSLEEEVQEKDVEIQQIKESKSNFDKMISENSKTEDGETKSLSMTDSVMVGDSLMGGVKIDKQINNDPEAIARAVIDAYRMGKSDSE